jgi:hypothetical protein
MGPFQYIGGRKTRSTSPVSLQSAHLGPWRLCPDLEDEAISVHKNGAVQRKAIAEGEIRTVSQ